MKAADNIKVTFPEDATKDITVSVNSTTSGGKFWAIIDENGTDPEYYEESGTSLIIPAKDNGGKTYTIMVDGATEYTFSGAISSLYVNHQTVTKITASGVELASFSIGAAPELETLDLSNNKLTGALTWQNAGAIKELYLSDNNLSTIDVTAASLLEKLDVSDNELTSLGSKLPVSLKWLDISDNGYKGSGSTDYKLDLSYLTNLEDLYIGGNTLLSVPTKEGVTVDKGIQDFTDKQYTSKILANQNLKLTDFANAIGMNNPAIIGASDWKKKTEGMDDPDAYGKTEDAQLVGNSKVDYLFYDSKGYYTDGEYECVLENADGYKYRVRMTVSPAEFKVKRNKLSYGAFIRALNNTGKNIFEYGEEPTVKQSEQLQVGVSQKVVITSSTISRILKV